MRPEFDFDFTTFLPTGDGSFRTSLIIEPTTGKAPLTPRARELMAEADALRSADGVEARNFSERCLAGVGSTPLVAAGFRQIVQTPDYLVIHTELLGETRVIGIGAQRRHLALTSTDGDSVARWEGDALVVETTNGRADFIVRQPGFVVRPASKVVERFRLTHPDVISYTFTVEDSEMYSSPWSVEFSLVRSAARTFETACHEGNYALPNILRAARVTERKPAE